MSTAPSAPQMASRQSDTFASLPGTAHSYIEGGVMDFQDVVDRFTNSQATVICAPHVLDYYNKAGQRCSSLQTPVATINSPPCDSLNVCGLPDEYLTIASFLKGTAYEIAKRQRQTLRARESAKGADRNAERGRPDTTPDYIHVVPETLEWVIGQNLSRAHSLPKHGPSSLQDESALQGIEGATSPRATGTPCAGTNVTRESPEARSQFRRAKSIFMGKHDKVSIASYYKYHFINKDDEQCDCDTHRLIQNGRDPRTLAEFENLSRTARTEISFQDQSEVLRRGLKDMDRKRGRVLYVEPAVLNMLWQDPEVHGRTFQDGIPTVT
jgi:hypothetical protein